MDCDIMVVFVHLSSRDSYMLYRIMTELMHRVHIIRLIEIFLNLK